MSRDKFNFNIIWEDPWGGPKAPIPAATEAQLSYLEDLVNKCGWEPDGYDPETLNIRQASAMIEELLGD